MQASSITHNIIKAAVDSESLHILSDSNMSLFDSYISSIDELLVFPTHNSDHDYTISYDIVFSNNPIAFSDKVNSLIALHLNSIIYFHSKCPNSFKKEDKFLLKNSINSATKVFSSQHILNSWGFSVDNKTTVLNYGVSAPNQPCNKTRSVVVLNTNNNPSVSMLFGHINRVFKDSIIITDARDPKCYTALRESAICVEAESAFNAITAIANGCYTISAIDYISEDGLYRIDSYNNIIMDIHKNLEAYSIENATENQQKIIEKYPDKSFKESFIRIINKARQEPYIYAKTN